MLDVEHVGCSVCLNELEDPQELVTCRHCFCRSCLERILNDSERGSVCPLCRRGFTRGDMAAISPRRQAQSAEGRKAVSVPRSRNHSASNARVRPSGFHCFPRKTRILVATPLLVFAVSRLRKSECKTIASWFELVGTPNTWEIDSKCDSSARWLRHSFALGAASLAPAARAAAGWINYGATSVYSTMKTDWADILHCLAPIPTHPGCIMWRQTSDCSAHGPREPQNDKRCSDAIVSGWSGYCECANGRTLEKDCTPFDIRSCGSWCAQTSRRASTVDIVLKCTRCLASHACGIHIGIIGILLVSVCAVLRGACCTCACGSSVTRHNGAASMNRQSISAPLLVQANNVQQPGVLHRHSQVQIQNADIFVNPQRQRQAGLAMNPWQWEEQRRQEERRREEYRRSEERRQEEQRRLEQRRQEEFRIEQRREAHRAAERYDRTVRPLLFTDRRVDSGSLIGGNPANRGQPSSIRQRCIRCGRVWHGRGGYCFNCGSGSRVEMYFV